MLPVCAARCVVVHHLRQGFRPTGDEWLCSETQKVLPPTAADLFGQSSQDHADEYDPLQDEEDELQAYRNELSALYNEDEAQQAIFDLADQNQPKTWRTWFNFRERPSMKMKETSLFLKHMTSRWKSTVVITRSNNLNYHSVVGLYKYDYTCLGGVGVSRRQKHRKCRGLFRWKNHGRSDRFENHLPSQRSLWHWWNQGSRVKWQRSWLKIRVTLRSVSSDMTTPSTLNKNMNTTQYFYKCLDTLTSGECQTYETIWCLKPSLVTVSRWDFKHLMLSVGWESGIDSISIKGWWNAVDGTEIPPFPDIDRNGMYHLRLHMLQNGH